MYRLVRMAGLLTLWITLAGCGIVGPSELDELDEKRQLWEAQGLSDYDYTIQRGCFCGASGWHRVEVRASEVALVTHIESGTVLDPAFTDGFTDIDGVFDLVAEALREADEITVEYDEAMGFPKDVSIDYITDAVDDELSLVLTAPTPPS